MCKPFLCTSQITLNSLWCEKKRDFMPNLIIEKHDSYVIVKINRPESLNSLNVSVLNELLRLSKEIKESSAHLEALILTGEGSKSFIAGADIKAMSGMNALQMLDFLFFRTRGNICSGRCTLSNPGGSQRICSWRRIGNGAGLRFYLCHKRRKLGLPEITLGIIPGFGGTQRLARAIGQRQAKEMILSGKMITADEAHALGIVNQVFEPEELISSCEKTVKTITKYSLTAIRQAKEAINNGLPMGLSEDFLVLEKNLCAVYFATPEREKSMQAFLNKKS